MLCNGRRAKEPPDAFVSVWEELHAGLGDRLAILLVAAQRGWDAEEVLHKLDDSAGWGIRIFYQEAPSDKLLRWLYSACQVTVFPSVLEGWGLPVGESLWFGKVCAASNASSFPAVRRDLCVLFLSGSTATNEGSDS